MSGLCETCFEVECACPLPEEDWTITIIEADSRSIMVSEVVAKALQDMAKDIKPFARGQITPARVSGMDTDRITIDWETCDPY